MKFTPQRIRLVALAGGILIPLLSYLLPLVGVAVFIGVWMASVSSVIYRFTSSHRGRPWRAFNILARLVGIGALAVGGAAFTEFALVGVPIVAVGLLLLRMTPYRPDLGDAALSDRTMRLVWGLPANWQRPRTHTEFNRKWWTGDPVVRES